jgi:hypothetical protein
MEQTVDDAQTRTILKQVLIELVHEQPDLFSAIVVEALEEVGLANAIREGRQNDFVSEAEITAILEGRA